MKEVIQEFCDSRDVRLRVDREKGVLLGVKVLGLRSNNGRRYQEKALSESVALYEGAKVNINHPKGSPFSPRDYQDRIGVLRNVSLQKEKGLFGDLYFNPKHALAEQLLWDAEHATENVGFSHNVLAHTKREAGETIVEKITQVTSVDLVADPATTRSLFESAAGGNPEKKDLDRTLEPQEVEGDSNMREQSDLVGSLLSEQTAEIARLRREIDRMEADAFATRRRESAIALLREHGLPDPGSLDPLGASLTGPAFFELLLHAADDHAMRRLVEERAELVDQARRWPRGLEREKPVSRSQILAEDPARTVGNGLQFAKAIGGPSFE